jgi:hypothetical protein
LRRENVSGARSSTHWNSQPEKWIVALIAGNSDSSRRNAHDIACSGVANREDGYSKFPTGWMVVTNQRRRGAAVSRRGTSLAVHGFPPRLAFTS